MRPAARGFLVFIIFKILWITHGRRDVIRVTETDSF